MRKKKSKRRLSFLAATVFIVLLVLGILFLLLDIKEVADWLVIAAFALVFIALLVELEKEFRLLVRIKERFQFIYNLIKRAPGYFTKATPKQNWLTRFSSAHPRFALCALFLVVTCIFLLPLLFQMQSAVYGLPGDTWSSMWGQWWKDYARENNLDFLKVSLVNAPFGLDNTGFPFQVLQVLAYDYLYKVAGPYLYRNILTLLSFFLSALFTYMLVHYLTRSRLAGVVSGIVFALSPYHLFHAYQHLDLANIQWIPLFALSLVKLVSEVEHYSDWKKLLKNVAFCTVSYALVIFESYYYGYMVAILTFSFLLIYLIYRSTWKLPQYHGKKIAIALVLTLLLVTIVVLPFIYEYVKTSVAQPEGISSQKPAVYSRVYPQLFFFSAHLRDYCLPSVDHPLWGGGVERIVSKFKDYDNLFENTLFLGYLPLLLTALALVRFWRGGSWRNSLSKKSTPPDQNLRRWTFTFALLALVMVIFSAPPVSRVFGIPLYFPSHFLHKLFPMFRAYARFGILVMLGVAVLAGIGLTYLLQRIRTAHHRSILVAIIIGVVMLEFANFPPYRTTRDPEMSEFYQWLASQPRDVVIAEYPLVSSEEPQTYQYLCYQKFHQKKLLNGAMLGTVYDSIRKELVDISRPETVSFLKSLGMRYIIIHNDLYLEGPIPRPLQRYYSTRYQDEFFPEFNKNQPPSIEEESGLKLVWFSGELSAYEVTAKPLPLILAYHMNIGEEEDWGEEGLWRWMENNGEIILLNTTTNSLTAELEFKAGSFHIDRHLEIYLNNKLMANTVVNTGGMKEIELPAISLKPGINFLRLYTTEGAQNIDQVLQSGDFRDVSICLSPLQIILK